MEEMQTDHEASASQPLAGASVKDEAFFTDEDTSELPMVVWLRGDETYAEEFSVDAEAAMQMLGIKRSRLTQISGKELRVGRIRINRYIRPMYRDKDLQDYKQWTRATATHMRSSSVISQAATKLEDHAYQLSQNLLTAIGEFNAALTGSLKALQADLSAKQQAIMQMSQNQIESMNVELLQRINSLQDVASSRFDEVALSQEGLNGRLAELTEIKEANGLLKQEIEQLKDTSMSQLQSIGEKIDKVIAQGETQSQFNRDIGKALSLILQFQREQNKKQEELMTFVKSASQDDGDLTRQAHIRIFKPARRLMRNMETQGAQDEDGHG